ncbi:MAG: flagellar export chaperone FlgN [Nitrospinae bacterium]|nr:flagellar export chaperone FlgN [Nitrospinota bacterium]MBL7021567.1 flagellar export chaperone FlgN [Nitrospinaceae bacterium]
MNRLYKNLEDLLRQKIKLYENFIELLKDEWNCVSKYSYDGLQEIIAKKEDQVVQMQALENSRSCLMKKIATKLEVRQSSLTLKKLIQIKDNPYKNNLTQCRKRLLFQVTQISEWSEKVRSLMDHSALSLKKSMAYIHSADEKASSPYLANGQMMEGRVEGRMVSMDV